MKWKSFSPFIRSFRHRSLLYFLFVLMAFLMILYSCFESDSAGLVSSPSTTTPLPTESTTPTPTLETLEELCSVYHAEDVYRLDISDVNSDPEGLGNFFYQLFFLTRFAIQIDQCAASPNTLSSTLTLTGAQTATINAGLYSICPAADLVTSLTFTPAEWAYDLYGEASPWLTSEEYFFSLDLKEMVLQLEGREIFTDIVLEMENMTWEVGLSSIGGMYYGTMQFDIQVDQTMEGLKKYLGGVYCGGENNDDLCTSNVEDLRCSNGYIDDFSNVTSFSSESRIRL